MQIEKDGYPNPPKQKNVGGCLFTVVLLFLLFSFFPIFNGPTKTEVPYSQFRSRVREGKVGKVIISEDRVEYFLKEDLDRVKKSKSDKSSRPEKVYVTVPLADDQTLPKLLEDNNVEFGVQPNDGGNWIFIALGWLIPPFLLFLIFGWIASRAQGEAAASNPFNTGKSKARIYLGNSNGS